MSSKPTEFKIIPDDSEIAAIERDLRFHKVSNPSPSRLSEDEIQHFNRNGYLRPFEVFDAEEVIEWRSYFDDLLQAELAAGRDSYSISSAHCRLGRVHDLIRDPRIVEPVSDLLGDNVIGWGSHFFCKMPGDGKQVAWHQDASYWPLSPSKAVTVWLAIDDAAVENACMNFISGSHHFGHLTFRPSSSEEHNVLNQTIENPEQYGDVVHDELAAGQFSIHSDLLLHGSDANRSEKRRCGLTLRYCSADVRAHLGWHEKGVWVKGSDPSAHWSNRPRPTID